MPNCGHRPPEAGMPGVVKVSSRTTPQRSRSNPSWPRSLYVYRTAACEPSQGFLLSRQLSHGSPRPPLPRNPQATTVRSTACLGTPRTSLSRVTSVAALRVLFGFGLLFRPTEGEARETGATRGGTPPHRARGRGDAGQGGARRVSRARLRLRRAGGLLTRAGRAHRT